MERQQLFLNNSASTIQIFIEHYFYKVPLKSLKQMLFAEKIAIIAPLLHKGHSLC